MGSSQIKRKLECSLQSLRAIAPGRTGKVRIPDRIGWAIRCGAIVVFVQSARLGPRWGAVAKMRPLYP